MCNLGYVLHPDNRGQGYGTELGRAAVDYAFGVLGVARLETGTAAANEPSCRLLRGLGFGELGREMTSLREDAEGRKIAFEGVRFELTRAEWEEASGSEQAAAAQT